LCNHTVISTRNEAQTSSVETGNPLSLDDSKPFEAGDFTVRVLVLKTMQDPSFQVARVVHVYDIIIPRNGQINAVGTESRTIYLTTIIILTFFCKCVQINGGNGLTAILSADIIYAQCIGLLKTTSEKSQSLPW
jgi:hypothetical protein